MARSEVLDLFLKQDAEAKERIEYGIEHYRKGDFTVQVLNKDGSPNKGAKVSVKLKNHEFRHGANIFMLDELETEEKNKKYKEYFVDAFNMATLPFYWADVEPIPGQLRFDKDSPKVYRRPPVDLCMEFCEAHGIEPREHALAYDHFFPKWISDYSVNEVKDALEKQIAKAAERYKNKIPTIEVTNEMEWPQGVSSFYSEPDYIEWCFKTVRKYFPDNQLVINESTRLPWGDRCRTTDKYYAYVEANILKGVPIDAVGMQYHMFFKKENEYNETRIYYNPRYLYRHMDMYARLGKPLQITEVTVPAYSNSSEDEELQAEIIRRLYEVWFSHPAVEQIIYWNLVDGYAYVDDPNPEKIKKSQGDMTLGENVYYGGLLRFDMTPKPAYYVVRDLFNKVWHTEEDLLADENGNASFRGFFGSYEVLVDGKKFEIDATKKTKNEKIIIYTE